MKKNLLVKVVSMSMVCGLSVGSVSHLTHGAINSNVAKAAMRCVEDYVLEYGDGQRDLEDTTYQILRCLDEQHILKTKKDQDLSRCMSRCDYMYGGSFESGDRGDCKQECFNTYRF